MTSSSRDHLAKIAFLLYVATITQSSYRHLLFTFQGPFIPLEVGIANLQFRKLPVTHTISR